MPKKQKITSQELLYGICFALCFFAFMLTEAFINERCAEILGSEAVNPVYTSGLVCTGLGFLSFPLLRRFCRSEGHRKTAFLIIGALCLISAACLLSVRQPDAFLISSAASLLLFGHISACVHYNTAMEFAQSIYTGRVIGIGMGAAILLQFVVQKLMPQSITFIITIFLSVAFVLYFIIRTPKDWILENPLPYSSDMKSGFRKAVILIAAVVLMSLVSGMIDSVLTAFNAEKAYDVYSGVRLFYSFGLILAGFAADVKERRYLPVATVCAILLSSICILFLSEEISYFAGTALMYLYSGFYVMFFTVMFLDFAPKSSSPELWAGMGRIVRSITVAVTVLPTIRVYDAVGSTALAVGSCVFSVATLVVLLPYISTAVVPEKPQESIPEKKELTEKERLNLFAEHCLMTPRETEVLEKLLTTEDGVQEISNSMYISRRMLQRYISSIYEKTGSKTRIGLYQNYIMFISEHQ